MTDRWLNAVVTVIVPLDLPLDASAEAKERAVAAVMDDVGIPSPEATVAGHVEYARGVGS